jgi:hypothetical protein
MIDRLKYMELWENDRQRRDDVQELLDIYDHQWEDLLVQKLEANFASQNITRMISKLDTSLNLLRWSSDTLAPIYAEGCKRMIEGQPDADLSAYTANGILDLTLDRASRLLFAVRELLLRPIVDSQTGTIIIDIITPAQCSVLRNPDNPLQLDGLVYKTASGQFVVWEADDHAVYDRGWQEQRKPDGEPYANDYGMVPFVFAHALFPERGTWHQTDANGLKAATLNLGLAKTDYNHKRHLQSHKQMVFTGVGERGIGKKAASDPSYAIVLKDAAASASVLDLHGDLQAHLNSIIQDAAQTLSLYGINPGAVKGSLDASSGYALSIKMTDTERVWKQQRTLWQAWEQQLYDVTRRVLEVDGGQSLPEGRLVFLWPDIGPEADRASEADFWLKLLQAGVVSVPEIRRALFDETPEALAAWMEEQQEWMATMSPLAPPRFEARTLTLAEEDETQPLPVQPDA